MIELEKEISVVAPNGGGTQNGLKRGVLYGGEGEIRGDKRLLLMRTSLKQQFSRL